MALLIPRSRISVASFAGGATYYKKILATELANLIGYLHRKDVNRLNRATGVPLPASAILEKIESLIT